MLTITNSTFTGNAAACGAGDVPCGDSLYNSEGTVIVTNSTFMQNESHTLSTIRNDAGLVELRNTIVANTNGRNCAGIIIDGGHNLDDGTSCGFSPANGSLNDTDPQLDPAGLQFHGGPTHTVALCTAVGEPTGCTAVSPAIGAGDQAVCAAALVNNHDQRGFVRPGTGRTNCSIGSYEADATVSGTTFTKITTGDIVTIPATYWNGAWGDYDDDGWLDLFVGASFASKRNYLFHNNGDGAFTLVDDAAMPKSPSNQHGAAWGDYDNDGHVDLIVTAGNPEVAHNVLYRNSGDGTFSWVTDSPIYAETYLYGFHAVSWGDYDNDGFLDLFFAGHDDRANRLFRNNGDGSFNRVTDSAVVGEANTSEGRAWVDYDNDGDQDLFVANSAPYANFLYRNEGNELFTKVTDSGLTDGVDDSIACCWADYDNDGFLDVFLANARKNSLYHNNGNGTFTSMIESEVVADTIPPEALFPACAWGDYDNDGFIDLFVTVADNCAPNCCGCGTSVPPRLHNFLYHNHGDGTFTQVTEGTVVSDLVTQCPGASWGDYDNDGFLDLFVSQGAFMQDPQTNLLYRNEGNSHAWLNVKLVGTVSNRSAIGAKVRVNAVYRGARRWQVRDISGGDSGSNQSNALNAAFGLADATSIDAVRIEWPSGTVQELRDVAARQFLTITEPLCTGDCDGSGGVTVNELVRLVNIILGTPHAASCRRGVASGRPVGIAVLVQAVNSVLNGCGG